VTLLKNTLSVTLANVTLGVTWVQPMCICIYTHIYCKKYL